MFHAVVELLPNADGIALASWTERRISDRLPTEIKGNVRARGSGMRIKAEIVDLSPEGCKLLSTDYSPGDEVLIALAHLSPIAGRVRWVKEGAVGVEFATKLHPSVVKHLAAL